MAEGAKHPTASERSERSCDHHLSALMMSIGWIVGWRAARGAQISHRERCAPRSGSFGMNHKKRGLLRGLVLTMRHRFFCIEGGRLCFWLNGRERSEAEKSQSRASPTEAKKTIGVDYVRPSSTTVGEGSSASGSMDASEAKRRRARAEGPDP